MKPKKPVLSTTQQAKLGSSWLAVPKTGMDRSVELSGTGKLTSNMLVRGGFNPRQGVLIYTNQPRQTADKQIAFRVWYLFGHVVAWLEKESRSCAASTSSAGSSHLAHLTGMVQTIAQITGLDWFVTEALAVNRSKSLVITDPANALARLGPGLTALTHVPDDVMRIAAQRLVEVAWRKSLPTCLASPGPRLAGWWRR